MLARSRYFILTLRVLIFFIILSLLTVFTWWLTHSKQMQIREISCKSNFTPCQNEFIIAEAMRAKGQNILRYDTKSLKQTLLLGNFSLAEVTISKDIFAGKLALSLFTKPPVLALSANGLPDRFVLIDQDFRILDFRVTDPHLPTLSVPSLTNLQIGQSITSSYIKPLQLVKLLSESFNTSQIYTLLNSTTLIMELDQFQVLLNPEEDQTKQVEALQAIVVDSTINKEAYKQIDMRFSKPVLRQN